MQPLARAYSFDEREDGRAEDAGDDDQQRAAAPPGARVVRAGGHDQRAELHDRGAGNREHELEAAVSESRPHDGE